MPIQQSAHVRMINIATAYRDGFERLKSNILSAAKNGTDQPESTLYTIIDMIQAADYLFNNKIHMDIVIEKAREHYAYNQQRNINAAERMRNRRTMFDPNRRTRSNWDYSDPYYDDDNPELSRFIHATHKAPKLPELKPYHPPQIRTNYADIDEYRPKQESETYIERLSEAGVKFPENMDPLGRINEPFDPSTLPDIINQRNTIELDERDIDPPNKESK